jgi:hypothetical protein
MDAEIDEVSITSSTRRAEASSVPLPARRQRAQGRGGGGAYRPVLLGQAQETHTLTHIQTRARAHACTHARTYRPVLLGQAQDVVNDLRKGRGRRGGAAADGGGESGAGLCGLDRKGCVRPSGPALCVSVRPTDPALLPRAPHAC